MTDWNEPEDKEMVAILRGVLQHAGGTLPEDEVKKRCDDVWKYIVEARIAEAAERLILEGKATVTWDDEKSDWIVAGIPAMLGGGYRDGSKN